MQVTFWRWQTTPMKKMLNGRATRDWATYWLVAFSVVAATSGIAAEPESPAAALMERHGALSGNLAKNQFARPLFLESSETPNSVSGNAYAILDSPFATVKSTFENPAKWCDVMILHLNTKFCRALPGASPTRLKVNIGKKTPQELKDAFALEFTHELVQKSSGSPPYLEVHLKAEKGPLGTSDYRIELSAVPLTDGKTFMHLKYSYGYGFAGRLAMQGYLATLGSNKSGFTRLSGDSKHKYVGGMRGVVERNTMRYYLAIEAYLASLSQPQADQFNARLERWFDATEQFPDQFHDIDRDSYLNMKKQEIQRQQSAS